jgi:polyisoprenyl-teichoic acid--peptidoglycan teichoic acid transferase
MNKTWKRVLIVFGIVIGLFVLSIGGYAVYIYHSLSKTASQVYKPLGNSKSDPLDDPSSGSGSDKSSSNGSNINMSPNAINILLLGVDERKGDKGRSDTMIVASLNADKNSMILTSIPRDTRVKLAGRTGYSKINAAYAYGNEALAVSTVEHYLNIPIAYYLKVNMEGLSSLVDAVGGVTVNNDLDWSDGTFHYKKGILQLKGSEALGYTRMRHEDPQGDFGRNARQRQVIQAVMSKGKSLTTITKINGILVAVGKNVQTNLTLKDMEKLATNYRQCRQNVTNYEVKGTPKYIGGVSWVLVSNQEFQNVHKMILNEMSKSKV